MGIKESEWAQPGTEIQRGKPLSRSETGDVALDSSHIGPSPLVINAICLIKQVICSLGPKLTADIRKQVGSHRDFFLQAPCL